MNAALRRLHPAITMVALCISLLALVAAAAGAGYAAATIGTAQLKNNAVTAPKIKNKAVTTKKIKNNAVTTKKVKDGSLKEGDLAAEEAQKAPAFSNGGEGDCVWTSAGTVIPGIGGPTFRVDRFGTVHMTGLAQAGDGPGGDGVCDPGMVGQGSDAIAFILPAAYIPAKTLLVGAGDVVTIIVGAQGFTQGTLVLPPGAVADGSAFGTTYTENVSFEPVGSGVVIPKVSASGRVSKQLLKSLGLG